MSTTKEGGQEEQDLVEIKKTIIIDASPQVVLKPLLIHARLTNWFPNGRLFLEPRVGGKMKFSFFKDSNAHKNMDFFPEGYC